MSIVDIAYFIAVLFDVILLSWYLQIFFKRKTMNNVWTIMIYIVAVLIYFESSVYFTEPYEKIIVYFFVCFILGFCYKGSIFYKLFFTTIYASIGIIIENSVSSFIVLITKVIVFKTSEINYVLGITISSILFLLLVCFVKIVWRKIGRRDEINEMKGSYWNLLFFILVVITVSISYGIDFLTLKCDIQNGILFYCLLEGLLVIFDIVVFFIFREMGQLQYEKMQITLISQQIKAQELFYKESIKKNQQLRKIVHDEKNFLLGLIGYLKDSKIEETIDEIENKLEQLVVHITDYTGNISLDTILTAKVDKAYQQGVILRPAIALYGKVYIDFLDLVLILGNALDNAIESAEKIEDKKSRFIYLTMKLQDEYLQIEIRNSVQEKVIIQNNRIETSKNDPEIHGLGLSNIEMLIEKYNGIMVLQCTDKIFTLSILLENIGSHRDEIS